MLKTTLIPYLTELFEGQASALFGVQKKRMFGCDAFFRGGTIFGLIWKEGRIGLKFPNEGSYEKAMALKGATPWKAGAIAMSRWVLVPPSFHDDETALTPWLKLAYAEATGEGKKTAKKKAAAKRAVAVKKTVAKSGTAKKTRR